MSAKHTPGPFGTWFDAVAEGYVAAFVKGSPWTSHAKRPGETAAACGKQPGKRAPGSTHRNRTGWRLVADGRAPTCEKCRAAIAKAEGGAS